jgi:glycosyltransferase involved in cell wall biosynthesis
MEKSKLRVAIVCYHYPPLFTSAAIQIRDLALEFGRQGHEPIVIVPDETLSIVYSLEKSENVEVLRLRAPSTRHKSYFIRTIAELLLPFSMMRGFLLSPARSVSIDLVVWYSPTIFLGPYIWMLSAKNNCRKYLILRDLFPEWAVDLGILKRGVVYWFFKSIAAFQYAIADVIGVQSTSNIKYLSRWEKFDRPSRRLEVLQNWLNPLQDTGCSINLSNTILAGRKVFVYIGNMGIAQGMDIFVELANLLQSESSIGFIFVGRGSEVEILKSRIKDTNYQNLLFYDEINVSEIPGLLSQCNIGLVALDPRHKTHNIPGKFLTYLAAGLPILARVNADTDLKVLIDAEQVGRAYVGDSVFELAELAKKLIEDSAGHRNMALRGIALADRMFSTKSAVNQIIASSFSV